MQNTQNTQNQVSPAVRLQQLKAAATWKTAIGLLIVLIAAIAMGTIAPWGTVWFIIALVAMGAGVILCLFAGWDEIQRVQQAANAQATGQQTPAPDPAPVAPAPAPAPAAPAPAPAAPTSLFDQPDPQKVTRATLNAYTADFDDSAVDFEERAQVLEDRWARLQAMENAYNAKRNAGTGRLNRRPTTPPTNPTNPNP